MSTVVTAKKNGFEKFLDGLEWLGNLLPSPFTIFAFLFAVTAVASVIVTASGATAIHPATGAVIKSQSLFTDLGLKWLLSNLVSNFTSYAPLGMVLVMTLGIGLCEEVGLMNALIRKAMANLPAPMVPYMVLMIGFTARIASDSSSLVIPPLAAIVYLGVGRHPVVGCLTGYAATAVGTLSNPVIAGVDALLCGVTNSAMKSILPNMGLTDALSNEYFKLASCLLMVLVMGFVSDKIVEPRFGKYTGKALASISGDQFALTTTEKKGLGVAGWIGLLNVALIATGMYIPGVLLDKKTGLINSPFLSGIIPIILVLFFSCGLGYGIASGAIKSEADVSKMLTKKMASLGSYIVMAFASAQFICLFDWTKMGTMLSINGALALKAMGLSGIPLMLLFIIFVAVLDFLIGSASAKWALCAPVFVPMFAMLGFHPAFTQLVYRIGDCAANVISPTNAFLWMLLDQCKEKYDPNATIGSFLSGLFAFFVASQVGLSLLMIVWMLLGLPVGPGAPIHLPAGMLKI